MSDTFIKDNQICSKTQKESAKPNCSELFGISRKKSSRGWALFGYDLSDLDTYSAACLTRSGTGFHIQIPFCSKYVLCSQAFLLNRRNKYLCKLTEVKSKAICV